MPYNREVSRQFPARLIFLLDQSMSMLAPMGGAGDGTSLMHVVAANLNQWIEQVIIKSTKGEDDLREYMDISVIGYTTDEAAVPEIRPALGGELSGSEMVGLNDLNNNVARIEKGIDRIVDALGEVQEMEVERRVWVEPRAMYGTPMCAALMKAHELASEWVSQHPDCFPPVVINFSDGEATDGDPREYGKKLMEISTNDGNLLLFNCHLSPVDAGQILFPNSSELLPVSEDPFSEILFDMSSPFPETFLDRSGGHLMPGARGMAFNANAVGLIEFLDIGTRAVITTNEKLK